MIQPNDETRRSFSPDAYSAAAMDPASLDDFSSYDPMTDGLLQPEKKVSRMPEESTEDAGTPNAFSSDEPMTDGLLQPEKKVPSMREKAQHGLGWTIVLVAMAAYALIIGAFIFGGRPSDFTEPMNYVLPSLQTLVAAVVGFYFGSREKD